MTHMLVVTALELRYPMKIGVSMKSDDASVHDRDREAREYHRVGNARMAQGRLQL
jgi:hypothetical protein